METEKESISPETVGSLFQNITDLLANASSSTEQQIFENWKAILSQLRLVESVAQGANNVEHVNIAISLRAWNEENRHTMIIKNSPKK